MSEYNAVTECPNFHCYMINNSFKGCYMIVTNFSYLKKFCGCYVTFLSN